MWSYIATIFFTLLGAILIFIILLQRGRGGGLAGAFGGLGGQSAFGTKAGDVFTKITVVLAVIWVAMAGITGFAHLKEWEGRYQEDADIPAVKAGEEAAIRVAEPEDAQPGEEPQPTRDQPEVEQPAAAPDAGEQTPAEAPSESPAESNSIDAPPANPGNE